MADVLVDTTIWVPFFRRGPPPRWRPALVDLLERDQVVIVDPIIAELLYGTRTAAERGVIVDLAQGTRSAHVDHGTWVATGDLGRAWRARGRTLSLVDCLLATVAARDGLKLWTEDRDFDPMFESGDLVRFTPR